jgi:hypothetical protein
MAPIPYTTAYLTSYALQETDMTVRPRPTHPPPSLEHRVRRAARSTRAPAIPTPTSSSEQQLKQPTHGLERLAALPGPSIRASVVTGPYQPYTPTVPLHASIIPADTQGALPQGATDAAATARRADTAFTVTAIVFCLVAGAALLLGGRLFWRRRLRLRGAKGGDDGGNEKPVGVGRDVHAPLAAGIEKAPRRMAPADLRVDDASPRCEGTAAAATTGPASPTPLLSTPTQAYASPLLLPRMSTGRKRATSLPTAPSSYSWSYLSSQYRDLTGENSGVAVSGYHTHAATVLETIYEGDGAYGHGHAPEGGIAGSRLGSGQIQENMDDTESLAYSVEGVCNDTHPPIGSERASHAGDKKGLSLYSATGRITESADWMGQENDPTSFTLGHNGSPQPKSCMKTAGSDLLGQCGPGREVGGTPEFNWATTLEMGVYVKPRRTLTGSPLRECWQDSAELPSPLDGPVLVITRASLAPSPQPSFGDSPPDQCEDLTKPSHATRAEISSSGIKHHTGDQSERPYPSFVVTLPSSSTLSSADALNTAESSKSVGLDLVDLDDFPTPPLMLLQHPALPLGLTSLSDEIGSMIGMGIGVDGDGGHIRKKGYELPGHVELHRWP